MKDRRKTGQERTEALAHRIYLQEKQPANHAQDHWLRAEDALRKLDDSRFTAPAGRASPDQLERATLHCSGHPAITGLALIHRYPSNNEGKFYPAHLKDTRMSHELPATLHLDETAETFDLVQLQSGTEGEACFDFSFRQ